jgi:SH3-like domain-containing protein
MRLSSKSLFLILSILLPLTPACGSSRLPEPRADAKTTEAQAQQNPVAAIVKTKKANLRDRPSQLATVVATVEKGDLLALTGEIPIGPWYQIRDGKSGATGWIHGNTITLLQTAETGSSTASSTEATDSTPTTTQRPRRVSEPVSESSTAPSSSSQPASGRSYINVDGDRVPSPVFSDTRPAGASARCRDGSYSFSRHRRGTCSHHGGVAEWY